MKRAPRITIVVDAHYGQRLKDLVDTEVLWVLESPVNSPQVRDLWDANAADTEGFSAEISTFSGEPQENREELCLRILETVIDHLLETSASEWSEMRFIGGTLTSNLRRALASLGATRFELRDAGFVAYASAPDSGLR